MTRSDIMMISAVNDRLPFQSGGREVTPHGERMDISLCGMPCASVDFDMGLVTVRGKSLTSRKSAKVFNAVLRTYTEASARSVHGRWQIRIPVGIEVEFSGDRIGIPISREFTVAKGQNQQNKVSGEHT